MKERKIETRKALLKRDGMGCQAEAHEPGCSCQGCRSNRCLTCQNISVDHFTSKAVARELGISHNQVERLANKQLLSNECHKAKDKDVPETARELRQQRKGRFIGLGEHAGTIYET